MAPAKKAAKKSTKKATAKKAPAKKAAAKKAPAKKAAKKSTKKAAKKTTKKTAKKSASRSAASRENVVVASKLRDAVRGQNIRMSGDFAEALNAEVHDLVTRAVRRAKGNNRGTVRPTDL